MEGATQETQTEAIPSTGAVQEWVVEEDTKEVELEVPVSEVAIVEEIARVEVVVEALEVLAVPAEADADNITAIVLRVPDRDDQFHRR